MLGAPFSQYNDQVDILAPEISTMSVDAGYNKEQFHVAASLPLTQTIPKSQVLGLVQSQVFYHLYPQQQEKIMKFWANNGLILKLKVLNQDGELGKVVEMMRESLDLTLHMSFRKVLDLAERRFKQILYTDKCVEYRNTKINFALHPLIGEHRCICCGIHFSSPKLDHFTQIPTNWQFVYSKQQVYPRWNLDWHGANVKYFIAFTMWRWPRRR